MMIRAVLVGIREERDRRIVLLPSTPPRVPTLIPIWMRASSKQTSYVDLIG